MRQAEHQAGPFGREQTPDHQAKFVRLLSTFSDHRSLLLAAAGAGRPTLAGTFVLLADQADAMLERVTACRIGGAATLLVCPNEQQAKAAVRSGACDFLLTGAPEAGLDEALRILKNEIRRRTAISVCLQAEPRAVLEACAQRGVQPDFLDTRVATLLNRGSTLIHWSSRLAEEETVVSWSMEGGPLEQMARLDKLAAAALTAGSREREDWLTHAPGVLGRPFQLIRLLPMEPEELSRFLLSARSLAEECSLQMEVHENAFGAQSVAIHLRRVL